MGCAVNHVHQQGTYVKGRGLECSLLKGTVVDISARHRWFPCESDVGVF
jgi:hypothetical protein